MDNRSLNSLMELLDEPILLRLHVANLRVRKDLDESVLGFIELYDACQGDPLKIKNELNESKSLILEPLHAHRFSKAKVNLVKVAAIFILIVLSTFLTYRLVRQDKIVLTSTFSDPGLPNFMGNSAHIDLSEAMFYYKKHEFEKAATAIEGARRLHPHNDTVLYYSALIDFEKGSHNDAMQQFESMAKRRSVFSDRAVYFTGVHAIELDQVSRAYRIFRTLIKSDDELIRAAAKAHLKQLRQYLH